MTHPIDPTTAQGRSTETRTPHTPGRKITAAQRDKLQAALAKGPIPIRGTGGTARAHRPTRRRRR